MHDELGGYFLQNSCLIGSVAAGAHVDLGEVLVLANYPLSILLVFWARQISVVLELDYIHIFVRCLHILKH